MSSDPRLSELEQIGLPRWLLDLAAQIGVDATLVVWRRLSDESRNDHRVSVPRWSTFMRYQRNRFILALDERGLPPEIIREEMQVSLREELSLSHIKRIIEKRKRGVES